ncbi:MAG: hypothetical protein NC337_08825 [Roseburia sp.]|nr:hypothetical protein [Roseburia sp.]
MEKNPYVPEVHFEQIPIKNLVSNQEYQRHLSQDHIRKAAKHFNLCQINPVKVSRRQGINYVFNGQHTIEIVALVSGSRDTPVWCMVYDELEYEQEAAIFANQQRFVKKLLPYEIFVANIEAGNDEQLIIKALVESFDLRICGNSKPGGICCVATLEDLYRKYGYDILQRSLRLCIATWEGDVDSLTGNMLRGIAHLIAAYKDSLKDDMFVEKVGRFSPREISRIAKERKAGSMGYAEAMLTLYNKKSSVKGTLKWAKLYENKQGLENQSTMPEQNRSSSN